MCGIVGIIKKHKSVTLSEIDAMGTLIKSRGPDGYGHWIKDNIGIAHTRLSIIDISTGSQPMFSEGGAYGIVFNGEIYNYKELKKVLITKGHSFRTDSDTEVLLVSYIEWGELCLDHLIGMFAFAIFDFHSNRIFLARDHAGIKPLVYYHDQDVFSFASEIRAFRKLESANLDLDLEAIDEYLALQYIPAPRTIYKNVKKLKPGHKMIVDFASNICKVEQYWDVNFKPNCSKSEAEWLLEANEILKDSVKRHLVSDVPFGAFLSGGIDSTLIVKYMSEIMNVPVNSFSIGFQESDFNELAYSDEAAKRYGTQHQTEILGSNSLEILPDLVRHYGEPFGDSSSVPTYFLSKLSRRSVPMVLSGDGADEIFCGYNSYRAWNEFLSKGDTVPLWKKKLRPVAENLFPRRFKRNVSFGDNLENWMQFVNYIPLTTRSDLWRPEYLNSSYTIESYERSFQKAKSFDQLNKVQYMDIKTYLPGDVLTKVDIASMMNGLEVRTPFIDKKVIEFASSIPSSLNFQGGSFEGKRLLKKILEKDFSHEFIYRKKSGFALPVKHWFEGEYKNYLRDKLLSNSSPLNSLLVTSEIEKIVNSKKYGSIWLLLVLDEWLLQKDVSI
jgi:asparagine synthase (glutamine-hydrolysing)